MESVSGSDSGSDAGGDRRVDRLNGSVDSGNDDELSDGILQGSPSRGFDGGSDDDDDDGIQVRPSSRVSPQRSPRTESPPPTRPSKEGDDLEKMRSVVLGHVRVLGKRKLEALHRRLTVPRKSASRVRPVNDASAAIRVLYPQLMHEIMRNWKDVFLVSTGASNGLWKVLIAQVLLEGGRMRPTPRESADLSAILCRATEKAIARMSDDGINDANLRKVAAGSREPWAPWIVGSGIVGCSIAKPYFLAAISEIEQEIRPLAAAAIAKSQMQAAAKEEAEKMLAVGS
jgi:hypothetical protein